MADARRTHEGMKLAGACLRMTKGCARLGPQRMASGLFIGVLIGAFNLQSPANADERVLKAVDHSTRFLIANWTQDKNLRKVSPPQVVPLAAGSRVYGACGEQIGGNEVGGSSYCSATHTIYLVPEELQAFYKAFGPSSVAYVVAHEFGHAIQAAYGIKLSGAPRELQADCLAGLVFRMGSRELGITRDSVLAMATAAYSIGSDSHGSGAKRSYSLLSGMGVFKATCESPQMQALAEGRLKDPVLQKLSQQRSSGSGPDTNTTPYPKTLQIALGL